MFLIVGLGNPGKKFKNTRHNIGFRVVDKYSKLNKFPPWKNKKEFLSLISEGKVNNIKIILAKPQTFMNDSARAIRLLIENFRLQIENLLLIHDEFDIPLGKIKISSGKNSAGHKGVQSIINELNTKEFYRFRIGIKQPNYEFKKIIKKNFVLEKFSKKEEEILNKILLKTCDAISLAITKGMKIAMNVYNK